MTTRTCIGFLLASLLTFGSALAIGADKLPAKLPDGKVLVATCVDGKAYYNVSGDHRGACSGHKGVASWADGSPVRSKGGGKTSYR